MKSILLGAAALALAVTAAQAASPDATSANFHNAGLPSIFRQQKSRLYCLGMVEGIAFVGIGVAFYSDDDPHNPAVATLRKQVCSDVPDQATAEQLVRVVVNYIDARPAADARALSKSSPLKPFVPRGRANREDADVSQKAQMENRQRRDT
jgi:hypothetical protein